MIFTYMNLRRYLVIAGLFVSLFSSAALAGENSQPTSPTPDQEINSSETSNSVLEIDATVLQGLDEAERDWYRRFQEGIMFFDGWSEISREILAAYPKDQVGDRKPMVQRLGVKIGTEWCKDNEIRKIDNPMLHSWGKKLRESIVMGHEIITETLLEIEYEVDMLLKKEAKVTMMAPQS